MILFLLSDLCLSSDYVAGNTLNAESLDNDFDRIIAMIQQQNTQSTLFTPYYAQNSNPENPRDLLLPILPSQGYFWSMGPGNAITATNITPDPAASALQAALASDNPTQGAALVNTTLNINLQNIVAHVNYPTLTSGGAALSINDYGKTILVNTANVGSDADLILPLLSSLPNQGWWVKIGFTSFSTPGMGFLVVRNAEGVGTDNIIQLPAGTASNTIVGLNRCFTFAADNDRWWITDNEFDRVGEICVFSYIKTEGEWLICDGRPISRTTYSVLFNYVGTTWGPGDGSTTFNIPDVRGRGIIGSGTGSGLTARVIGQIGGEEDTALIAANNGPHTHTLNGHAAGQTRVLFQNGSGASNFGAGSDTEEGLSVDSSGSGTPHNTMQPFAVGQTMIKVF